MQPFPFSIISFSLVIPFDPQKIAIPDLDKRRRRRRRRPNGINAGNSMSPQRVQPTNASMGNQDMNYSGYNDYYGNVQGQINNDQGFPVSNFDQGDWGNGFDSGIGT